MLKNKQLIVILALGLFIRIIFIQIPGFGYDVGSWFAWSIRLDQVNLSNFYSDRIFTDYLPGYLYILKALGFLKSSFHIQDNLFYEILKLPSIISELITGALIYLILKQTKSIKIAFWGSIFFLLDPPIIFNGAIWGQIDGVLTLFLLGSVYFLKKRALIISSIIFSIAFLIKPQAIAIAPVFFLYLIRKFSLVNLIKITLPGIIVLILLTIPFFPTNPIGNLLQKLTQTSNEYPYTSLNAYNFWGLIGFWKPDSIVWNSLSYQIWSYILFLGYWLIVAYLYLKRNISIYSLATLATLAFFFLPTRVHERYLYPALVFLIIASFQLKSKLLISLMIFLNFLHLINLYYVYINANKIQLNLTGIFYSSSLYNLISNQPFLLSLLSTVIFIIISIIIIRLNYVYQKNSI